MRDAALPGQTTNLNGVGSVNIQPTYGLNPLSYSGTARYVGMETVTVPYGTVDAHHVSVSITSNADVQGTVVSLVLGMDIWLARDLGVVKYQLPGETAELVDVTIASAGASQPVPTAEGGSSGGGCVINRNARPDPLLPLTVLAIVAGLWRRRLRQGSQADLITKAR